MMIHRSLKVEEDVWCRMEEKARVRGFTSTNAYLRHIIQEDLSGGTLEEAEERLVSTISKLSAHVQSVGTMHQASFATLGRFLNSLSPGLCTRLPGSPRGETVIRAPQSILIRC